jgi:hypothetical protein
VSKDIASGAFAWDGLGENADDVLVGVDGFIDRGFVENFGGGVLESDDLVFCFAELGVAVDDLLGKRINCIEGRRFPVFLG